MFRNTLLALAAGGAIMIAALAGSTGTARADTSVHIGIGLPGIHLAHSSRRYNCWLPERHLCGPRYGRPVYSPPYYAPPVYGWPVYRAPVYHGGYWAPPPPPSYYGRYRRW